MQTMIKNNNFEVVRKKLKLTNRDFAKLIGIGETAYSKLKKGELPVGEQTIIKIKEAFPEYNLEWLLYGIEPKESKYKPAPLEQAEPNNINIEQNDLMNRINDLTERISELKEDKDTLLKIITKQDDRLEKQDDKLERQEQIIDQLQKELIDLRSQLGSSNHLTEERSA